MPIWSDAPTVKARFAVGDVVYSGDHCRGRVAAVDAATLTMGVVWDDSEDSKAITYPIDAPYLREKMPWEPG